MVDPKAELVGEKLKKAIEKALQAELGGGKGGPPVPPPIQTTHVKHPGVDVLNINVIVSNPLPQIKPLKPNE